MRVSHLIGRGRRGQDRRGRGERKEQGGREAEGEVSGVGRKRKRRVRGEERAEKWKEEREGQT